MSKGQAKKSVWLSGSVAGKNKSHLIAYIGVMTALNVVVNAYFSYSFGITTFSLTIFSSVLTGILIGPLFGFTSCFIGDFLGYFIGTGSANSWSPWLGFATAVMALIGGLMFNGIKSKGKYGWVVKLSLICLVTFVISTVAINTTALYLLWYSKSFASWWDFFITRMFLDAQILNNILNYALLFIVLPALAKVKTFKIHLN